MGLPEGAVAAGGGDSVWGIAAKTALGRASIVPTSMTATENQRNIISENFPDVRFGSADSRIAWMCQLKPSKEKPSVCLTT
jgi:hypothetical protein